MCIKTTRIPVLFTPYKHAQFRDPPRPPGRAPAGSGPPFPAAGYRIRRSAPGRIRGPRWRLSTSRPLPFPAAVPANARIRDPPLVYPRQVGIIRGPRSARIPVSEATPIQARKQRNRPRLTSSVNLFRIRPLFIWSSHRSSARRCVWQSKLYSYKHGYCYETYFSTLCAEAQSQPRFPCPHGHQEWPQGTGFPSCKRSCPPDHC